MIIVVLVILGLALGSFVNASVWRLHEQSKKPKDRAASDEALSISKGRSMCPHCQHQLTAKDLIPILSWVSLRGKCRYCKQKISWQYPLVELLTALLFVFSYVFWPNELNVYGVVYFCLWLVCISAFMALAIFDIRWMLLPNKIIFPLYGVVALMIATQAISQQSLEPLWRAVVGVLIGGGLFYLLFQISGGKWIGGGDVKLGFLLGAIVGGPDQALLMLFIASLLGTLVSLPLLVSKKVGKSARIPFGPFLLSATYIVVLGGVSITSWYVDTFIGA